MNDVLRLKTGPGISGLREWMERVRGLGDEAARSLIDGVRMWNAPQPEPTLVTNWAQTARGTVPHPDVEIVIGPDRLPTIRWRGASWGKTTHTTRRTVESLAAMGWLDGVRLNSLLSVELALVGVMTC